MSQNEPSACWQARFRAPRVSLPEWARNAPHRCVYTSNATGRWEIYGWDRSTGRQHQVTDRPKGTDSAAIDPTGEHVWWFADNDGDEFGVWMRQPFLGGADEPAAPGLDPAYPAGLALGASGLAVVGRASEAASEVALVRPGAAPRVLYSREEYAEVVDVSCDEELVALAHSEHGDSRHPALRVLCPDGSRVADLWDGPGLGLEGVRFAPRPGDPRLLVLHERAGRPLPLLWDPATGEVVELTVDLPGEIRADWYADATALLIAQDFAGRSALFRLDLATGALTSLDAPRGTVSAATARPDGSVEFAWSSHATPPEIRSTSGGSVLRPPGPPAPPSVPVTDVTAAGPDGEVHALLATPEGAAPYSTVVLVHGGPTWHDSDAFRPDVAAWVDEGFAVALVNYRGSTGYGTAWRDAIEGAPGLTELADIAAVVERLVATGVADRARLVLAGGSWGGYLTLLGLGTQPDLWAVGVATVPVADYVAAYEDEMEPLQAFDRALFGGSPTEVPDRYRIASPITYVDQVRAPVLVLAGVNDPRCPIRQIDNYLTRLAARGGAHEVYRYDAGHGSLDVEEQIRQMAVAIDFVRRHLGSPES